MELRTWEEIHTATHGLESETISEVEKHPNSFYVGSADPPKAALQIRDAISGFPGRPMQLGRPGEPVGSGLFLPLLLWASDLGTHKEYWLFL